MPKRALVGLGLGTVTLSAQVLLLRELWCITWGSEALAGVAVAAWLAAGGLGSAFGGRAAEKLLGPGRALGAVLAAFALAVPGAVLLLRWWPAAAGAVPGAVPDLAGALLYAAASLGAVGFLGGALFPLALRQVFLGGAADDLAAGAAAAELYRWDMLGSLLAGSALAALALAFGLGGLPTALLCGVVSLVLAAWLARPAHPVVAAAAAAGAALLAALTFAGLERRTAAWRHAPETLESVAETGVGRLAVTAREGQQNAYLSGRFAASPQAVERAEALAAVAAGECPRPERALLLGDPLAASAPELAAHGLRVTAVVPDRRTAETFAALGRTGAFPAELRTGDPRAALRAASERWDLIVIDAGPPETFAQGRLLTRECLARTRAALAADGVLAVVLPANPAHLSAPALRAAGSVWRALGAACPRRRLWALDPPGLVMIGFASGRAPVPRAEVAARVRRRGIKLTALAPERLADPGLERDVEERLRPALEGSGAAENRDARMTAVLDQMQADRLRLSRGAGEALRAPAGGGWWTAAAAAALGLALAALARARARSLPGVCAFAAGLCGAALEVAALVAYQVARGSLYAEIGLVLAAFMAGGAAGAGWARRRAGPEGRRSRATCALPLAALALASGAAGGLALAGPEGLLGGALWIALVAAAGAGVGAAFSAAAVHPSRPKPGAIYGLDLAGAALGGLIAVFAVPWAGLAASAAAAGLLAGLVALGSLLAPEA